jgi:hypothetical protein
MLRAVAFSLCTLSLCTLFSANVLAQSKLAVIPTQFDETAQGQVPALFDDYLLTAVQNLGGYEVIGQDDIAALLGFEQQKELIDCSDTSCIADLGGALGVDKILIVKIARLGNDWVATAKIINIRETKVESRVNEIVPGEVKDLLRSIPALVNKLFGSGSKTPSPPPPSSPAPGGSGAAPSPYTPPAPSPGSTPSPMPSPEEESGGPNDNFGGGARVGGTIMMISGAVGWVLGALTTTMGVILADGELDDLYGDFIYIPGVILFIGGQVVVGVGAKIRANGNARRDLATESASGSPKLFWLGWTLAGISWGLALLTPPLFISLDIDATEIVAPIAVLTALGSTIVFMIGGWGAYSAERSSEVIRPVPSVGLARLRNGDVIPTAGLSFTF